MKKGENLDINKFTIWNKSYDGYSVGLYIYARHISLHEFFKIRNVNLNKLTKELIFVTDILSRVNMSVFKIVINSYNFSTILNKIISYNLNHNQFNDKNILRLL